MVLNQIFLLKLSVFLYLIKTSFEPVAFHVMISWHFRLYISHTEISPALELSASLLWSPGVPEPIPSLATQIPMSETRWSFKTPLFSYSPPPLPSDSASKISLQSLSLTTSMNDKIPWCSKLGYCSSLLLIFDPLHFAHLKTTSQAAAKVSLKF